MHELVWRQDCLQRLGRERAMALFAEHEGSYGPIHHQLDMLADLAPGPELIGALVRLQPDDLDTTAQVQLSTEWARVAAWVEAQSVMSWAAATHDGNDESDRLVAAELAAATHISHGSAQNRVGFVRQVSDCLQPGLLAMTAGQLSGAHIRALAEATRNADDEVTRQVADRVVPRAIDRGWTPAELKAAADRAVRSLDPDGAADRHRRAAKSSDVNLYGDVDDMASITATTAAPLARQIMDTIDARALELQRDGDQRSLGQLRVSALARAVLGEEASRPAAEIVVTIDLTTLLGLTSTPGELSGYGPINADLARRLAADGTLRRLITDPLTGMALDLGRTRYQPSRLLRRLVVARDRNCRFPGCRRPARRCDLDHRTPYGADGRTADTNLHPLCEMHHGFKTRKAWHAERDPASGATTWTSPLGFTYQKPAATYPHNGPDPTPLHSAVETHLATVIDITDSRNSARRGRPAA